MMKILNLIFSLILIVGIVIVFSIFMYTFNPIFLVFVPFAILFYLSIGWALIKAYRNGQFDDTVIKKHSIVIMIIFNFPAYYLISSISNLTSLKVERNNKQV